jgi:hypothetical protein
VKNKGNTLSGCIEGSLPDAMESRCMQTRFDERGEAAWQHYQRTGVSRPADEVLAKLQAKLDTTRKRLGG